MKIVVENTVCLNAGDAAILIAIMRIMRFALGDGVEFHVFDKNPDVAARYYKDINFYPLTTNLLKTEPLSLSFASKGWNIRIRRNIQRLKYWRYNRILRSLANGVRRPNLSFIPFDREIYRNLKIYAEADLIISTGGTYLVEHYDMGSCFEEYEKDLALHKPLVLFTQSLGPFLKPENVSQIKALASRAKLILLRDAKSENNLRQIGVPDDNLEVVSDSVFAMADVDALKAPFPGAKGERMSVAVSVREWHHFDNLDAENGMRIYKQAVADAVTALIREKNCEVVFLSTCQGIAEYRYDDSVVALEIFAMLDPQEQRSVIVDRNFHDPDSLMEKIRSFDFVISTRMHMAILSLCCGVPVLPIAYEFKTTELYRGISQADWITDISNIVPETFSRKAIRFSEQLEQFYQSAIPEILNQALSARSAGALVVSAAGLVPPTNSVKSA